MGEFDRVVSHFRKLGLVVVMGIENKIEDNLIIVDHRNYIESPSFLVGREVMFVVVDPIVKFQPDFNQNLFMYCISRIRGSKLNRYSLDDGTIVVEGSYD